MIIKGKNGEMIQMNFGKTLQNTPESKPRGSNKRNMRNYGIHDMFDSQNDDYSQDVMQRI